MAGDADHRARGRPTLVGRDGECRILEEVVSGVVGGTGGVVVLTGEAGMGRTALVEHLGGLAAGAGVAVAAAVAYPLAAETPYLPVLSAVRPLLADQPEVADGLHPLRRLFVDLDPRGGPPPAVDDADRTRLHVSLATVVSRLAHRTPLVMAVEDLHAADAATLEVLPLIAEETAGSPLALVVTARSPADGTRAEVSACVEALAQRGTHVQLGGLSAGDVAGLIRNRLGAPVRPALAAQVAERTGGNPLLVIMVVEELRDTGALGGATVLGLEGEAPSGPPPSVVSLLGARLTALSPPERRAVEILAVAGAPVTAETLECVLDDPDGGREVFDALLSLELAGLVTRRGVGSDGWRLRQPMLGEVALEGLPPAERRRWHRAFARALADADPVVVAPHILGAGPTAGDVGVLVEAARSMVRAGRPLTAGSWCAAIAAAVGDEDPEGSILCHEAAAEAFLIAGEADLARHHAEGAWRLCPPDDASTRTRLAAHLLDLSWRSGLPPPDWLAPDGALPEVGAVSPGVALRLEVARLQWQSREGARDRSAIRGLIARIRRLADRVGEPDAGLVSALADALLATSHGRITPGLLDRLPLRPPPGVDPALAMILANLRLDLVVLTGTVADQMDAIAELDRLAAARAAPRPWRAVVAEIEARVVAGTLEGRVDRKVVAAQLVPGGPRSRIAGTTSVVTAVAAGGFGDRDAVAAEVARMRERLALDADPVAGLYADALAVWDDPDPGVVARLVDGRGSWFQAGLPDLIAVGIGVAHLRAGPDGDLGGWCRRLRGFDGGAGRLTAWAEVLEAAASGDGEGPRRLAGAADRFSNLGMTHVAAHCTLRAAAWDPGAVDDDALGRAADDLARAGNVRLHRWARRVLAGRGVRTPPVDVRDDLGLTPRERQVAAEVAAGRTNREIAERLFISVRTVTSHLDHIYTKLGISSRSELARLVRAPAGS